MARGAGGRIDMTQGSLVGVLLRVAWPIAAAQLAQSVHQIVNGWFVGRLGADAIAAVAASGPLFGVLASLGSGLSTAGAVLVAQNTGAGKTEATDHIAAQTLLMVAAMAVLFAAFGYVVAPATLRLIGVEPAVFDLTWQYLTVSYVGLIPAFLFLSLQAMLQSIGEVRLTMLAMVGAVILNIVLDPLLIFGAGLGVRGAALATAISQSAAFLLVLRHVTSGRSALHLRRHHFRPDRHHFGLALRIGVPAGLEQGGRTFASLLLMSLAALFGTTTLAAYGVGTRPFFFWFGPMLGLSVATAAVIGQNIGAGQIARAERAARVAGVLSFGMFTLIGLIHLPLLGTIMSQLAPGDDEVVREAIAFGWAVFPFMGTFALFQTLNGVFRGAGSTRQAMTLALIGNYLFQQPFAWFAALHTRMGPAAIWWSYGVGNVLACSVAISWLIWGPWRRRLVDA